MAYNTHYYNNNINYVHTSSSEKYDLEINISAPTAILICQNCCKLENEGPISYPRPKLMPTLSFTASVNNVSILDTDDQFIASKSCMGSIIANTPSKKIELMVRSDVNAKQSSSNLTFLYDPQRGIDTTTIFHESQMQNFEVSKNYMNYLEYFIIHPQNNINVKIKANTHAVSVYDISKFNVNKAKKSILAIRNIINVFFETPAISNSISLILKSIYSQDIKNNLYSACLEPENNDIFYVKKNNNLISNARLSIVKSMEKHIAELSGVIDHMPGIFTESISCIKNLESPSCINYRSSKLLQINNPILNSMIMQCKFLGMSCNILIPADEDVPEILNKLMHANSNILDISKEMYLQIVKTSTTLFPTNRHLCTISLNEQCPGSLWPVLMLFNHPSEDNKGATHMPIILKSDKQNLFIIYNLGLSQIYLLPKTRRSIYAYIKNKNETIAAALQNLKSSSINQIATSKLYHFYQRICSDTFLYMAQDPNGYPKIVCINCCISFPGEMKTTIDSIKSESINTSNQMLMTIFENKYSPFMLVDKQKIGFK